MRFVSAPKRYDDVTTLDETDLICYCIEVDKRTVIEAIRHGAATLKAVKEATKACTGTECAVKNPNKRCCSKEIKQLIDIYARGERMRKTVTQTPSGINISFSGEVKKQNIVRMVQNCAEGKCECMSDETKAKITAMEVKGEDGDVTLELGGDVSKEEIEAALARSKVLNENA